MQGHVKFCPFVQVPAKPVHLSTHAKPALAPHPPPAPAKATFVDDRNIKLTDRAAATAVTLFRTIEFIILWSSFPFVSRFMIRPERCTVEPAYTKQRENGV